MFYLISPAGGEQEEKQDTQVRDEGGKRNQVFLTLVSSQTSQTKQEAVRSPETKVLVTGCSVRRGQDSLAARECPWSVWSDCLLLFCFRCSYHYPYCRFVVSINDWRDFPRGPVAKTPSSQCRGLGLTLGRGTRSHTPQWRSKILYAATKNPVQLNK